VTSFTRADCELLARYGSARVRWTRVDATSKRKLADVRERVKQVLSAAADSPQVEALRVPLATFVAPGRPNERVPAQYWGCLYPTTVPRRSFALQLAFAISGDGAELALRMGGDRREARDPKVASRNRYVLEEAQQQLATLPPDVIEAVDARLDRGWRFRSASRFAAEATRARQFDTLAEWVQFAASPMGGGASISCQFTSRALEKVGTAITDRFIEMAIIFAPLLEYVYHDVVAAPLVDETVIESSSARELPGVGATVPSFIGAVAEPAPSYDAGSVRASTAAPAHAHADAPAATPYTLDMAADGLFVPRTELEHMVALLDRRRNLILEGAPGVGKTYVARRLAYALLGATDAARMEMVQFHPSYSYEDFVQGWRPAAGGTFALRNGVFYEFCRAARNDPGRPYVFVIDEINRGNVAAIFGELLMLLERDKRGDAFAVPLTYALGRSDRFAIPENVYLIATMNTADRSVAMVDYALRRRFAFVRIPPAFGTPAFTTHLTRFGVARSLARRIVTRISALNTDIVDDRKRLGPGFEIGHSPFVPTSRGTYDEAWYADIIRTEIEPLLREYWFDDPDRVADAVAQLLS